MGRTIGIDLGTTNSCVAVLEGGHPSVIPNAEGSRTTPSVVAWSNKGEVLVGTSARRQAVTNPEGTVASIKRFMGRRLSEVAEEEQIVPYHVEAAEEDAARVRIGDKVLSPEEISSLILTKLKADAEAFLGAKVEDAVITVPAYFNDAQRQATKDAGQIAGLNVLRLVNEPTAAALAYGVNLDEDQTILVFDLGGGTFDVSVLDISEQVFEVRATSGDNQLGGDDFDKVLVDYIAGEFETEHGIDLRKDPMALQRLYEASEKAKIELSSMEHTSINLPYIAVSDDSQGPLHIQHELSRGKFTELADALLARLKEPTEKAMIAAKLVDAENRPDYSSIDAVLLVGGMTRMPAVAAQVKAMTDKDASRNINPDEAVAMGAAIQAGVLEEGSDSEVLLLDVTPLSLGIETKGGITAWLIESNTTIPTSESQIFTTAEDNQSSVDIHIVQGERDMAKDNRTLGRFHMLGVPPAPAQQPQIEVTFTLDANGILHVSAQDIQTGQTKEMRIESSTGLDPADVDRMRREAIENREVDLVERNKQEMLILVKDLRDQARRALATYGDRLEEADAVVLERLINDVDLALDSEDLDDVRRSSTRLNQVLEGLRDMLTDALRDDDMGELVDELELVDEDDGRD